MDCRVKPGNGEWGGLGGGHALGSWAWGEFHGECPHLATTTCPVRHLLIMWANNGEGGHDTQVKAAKG